MTMSIENVIETLQAREKKRTNYNTCAATVCVLILLTPFVEDDLIKLILAGICMGFCTANYFTSLSDRKIIRELKASIDIK